MLLSPCCSCEEEEESEDEPDFYVEYVEHDGRMLGVRVGPSSPAVLLVAGRCRWVTGWPYYLAASMAHRQRSRVTLLRRCFWSVAWFDSGIMFQRRRTVEVPISVHRQSGGFALLYRDKSAQCQTVQSRRLPCHGAEDVSLVPCSRPQRFPSCSLLLCCSASVVVQVLQFGYTPCGDSRDPTVAARFSGPCRSHARCVQRQMPMVDVLVQFIDGSHVPVITQRRLLSGSAPDSVIAGDSGHSSCATEMGT